MGRRQNEKIIEKIKTFKKRIGVEKIILFGSFARGKFNKHSDIDLLLISRKFRGKNIIQRSKGLWLKWNVDLPVDFICYTPEEFEKLKKEISIVSEALREGREI